MKDLKKILNESLEMVAEALTEKDFDKVSKIVTNDNKIAAFIKKDSSIPDDKAEDIIEIIKTFDDMLMSMIEDPDMEDFDVEKDMQAYIDDMPSDLYHMLDDMDVEADRELVPRAIELYKKLFHEITHKNIK